MLLNPLGGDRSRLLVSDFREAYTAHCVRIGTVSCLCKLGLNDTQVKLWLGWTPASAVWEQYVRMPVYLDEKIVFAKQFFKQALPA